MSGRRAVVIGGGPAGLMAAQTLLEGGAAVDLFDAMPSLGRKFLMAGRGGLNLTHAEPLARFTARYGAEAERFAAYLAAFPPERLRDLAAGLGVETFVGSSGRVFPREMKAAPLLRAWLRRLKGLGLAVHVRRRWLGFAPDGRLRFQAGAGEIPVAADAVVLALGGGSWPALGSDGGWVGPLRALGLDVAALEPANCGFEIAWSPYFAERFQGQPLKSVRLAFEGVSVAGEVMLTAYGIEGGPVYALSAPLRRAIAAQGRAVVHLDLKPGLSEAEVEARLARRGSTSLPAFLRKNLGLGPAAYALLREAGREGDPLALKRLPLTLQRPRPLAEAISSAGGVRFSNLDEALMDRARPGVFFAGEMLDWEAPTGGYLLQGCFATGHWAGRGALRWLAAQRDEEVRPRAD